MAFLFGYIHYDATTLFAISFGYILFESIRSNDILYSDLHYYFITSLRSTHCLIVSGISFNDKAINSRIIDWMFSTEPKKMIIINPDDPKLLARPAISKQLDEWIKKGCLVVIQKGIEDSSWDEISRFL